MEANVSEIYREAQAGVIGSVLIDPDQTLGIVMDALRPEDLSGEWRTVFEAIRSLWLERKPVDAVTVLERCGEGYGDFLRELMRLTPTAANAAAYCETVKRQAALLRYRDVGAELLGAVDEDAAREALGRAEAQLAKGGRLRVYHMSDLIGDFFRRMSAPEAPVYLPWGINALDEKLTAEPGDFILLGADSSVGKTALAAQFAWHMASKSRRVGFFSLETSAKKLTDRIVAQRARLAMEKIHRRQYETEDYKDVAALGNASMKVKLDVIEAAGASVQDLRAATVAGGYEVIFVDYVQLLRAEGKERWEIVTNISMALHELAQALGVAVVALSQITAAAKSNKARQQITKDDLRESQQLKQDADLILLLSLADAEDPDSLRWLRVGKNKDGPHAAVCLKFDAVHMTFTATDSRAISAWKNKPRTFRDVPAEETPFDGQEGLPL